MNFYFVLGVDRHASIDAVRRAYRRLARKYHPNINPGDPDATERYRLITEAYETLADAGTPAALRLARRGAARRGVAV